MGKIISAKEAIEMTDSAIKETIDREIEECREVIDFKIKYATRLGENDVKVVLSTENYRFLYSFYYLLVDELVDLGYICKIATGGSRDGYSELPYVEFKILWEKGIQS